MTRGRAYRWLAALPAIGIFVGVPLADRVHTYVLGLPFVLAWIIGCVLLTSALMAWIGALDRRADSAGRPAPGNATESSRPGGESSRS